MSLLDPLLAVLIVGAAVVGWNQGLVNRVTSWIGLLAGLACGGLAIPQLVSSFDLSDRRWLVLGAAVGLVLLGALGQGLGAALGRRLGRRLPSSVGVIDAAGGAVMGVVGVVVLIWLLAPAVRSVPRFDTDQVERSLTVRFIERLAPPAPDLAGRLESVTGPFPKVFAGEAPVVAVGVPPENHGLDPATRDAVAGGILRVRAIACAQRQDGTAFVVAPDLAVTNAHVVAGSSNIEVHGSFGSLPAEVIGYDPARDLALLGFADPVGAPLEVGDGSVGQIGAVFGHPLGGELRAAPARIAERVRATGRDLYDRFDTLRQVYFLSTSLQPGDSGGPLVDDQGRVVGVIFAISPEDDNVAFALTSMELVEFLDAAQGGMLAETPATGACL